MTADADHDDTVAGIEEAIRAAPGIDRDVATYSTQRMRDVGALDTGDNDAKGDGLGVLTGSGARLVARVYGHDLEVLRAQAERVRRLVADVDGVVDPRIELPEEQPNLVIEVDLARAQRFGIQARRHPPRGGGARAGHPRRRRLRATRRSSTVIVQG